MSNGTPRLAEIVTLPVTTARDQATAVTRGAASALWSFTATDVDDWGRDNAFVDRVWQLSRLRWSVYVGGAEHVAPGEGALIVVNARRFALAPVFAALAIGAAVDRPVRFVGRPDTAPLGPVLQRLGALLPIEAEIEGALRAGEVVVLGTTAGATNRRAGQVDHRLVGAAVAAATRTLPAATVSVPARRNARVEIGPPVRPPRRRRGPLTELELADRLHERLDGILDGLGGTGTGTPLDWLSRGLGGL